MRSQKIGLLGGSFNPAHNGHVQISETALRTLGLDQVWWLVSPQNPLKSSSEMARYEDRIESARRIAKSPRIIISDFERKLDQTYTAKTIESLKKRYRRHTFVWLMGADNMVQVPKWYQWRHIFDQIPVAVFDRPGYTYQALFGHAARIYGRKRFIPVGSGRPAFDFANEKCT